MKNSQNSFEILEQERTNLPHPSLKRKIKSPNRYQIEFTIQNLDDQIPQDHQARTVWGFVEQLDFTQIYEQFSSIEGVEGRPLVDPRILVSLWIYAICDGVISARKIAKYCIENQAYAWICGGVSVGHHLLSGFRARFSDIFEDFVVQSIALLTSKGLLKIKKVAQDGMKQKAFASSSSMHRKKTLMEKTIRVRQHIRELEVQQKKGDLDREERKKLSRQKAEADKKKNKLIQAAQELQKHKESLNNNRAKNRNRRLSKQDTSKLRISSTDPECRKMKMPDKSYKPAYNVQIATDVDTDLVLKTSISQNSHDGGHLLPMFLSLRAIYGDNFDSYLADSAFRNQKDFEELYKAGCSIYMPSNKKKTAALRKKVLSGDLKSISEVDIDWIKRMETEEANELYNRRIRASETINAFLKNHGLGQAITRGVRKIKGMIDLACLAYNILTIKRLYNIV